MAGSTNTYNCNFCGNVINRPKSNLHLYRCGNLFCNKKCQQDFRNSNLINFDYFDMIDSKEKAYWIGFIYADGNITRKKQQLQINLSSLDECHLSKFAKIFASKIKNYSIGGCSVRISNRHLCQSLDKIGIIPCKTYEDKECKIVNNIPVQYIKSFILGLFDGDGSIWATQSREVTKTKITCTTSFCGNRTLMKFLNKYFNQKIGTSLVKIQQHQHCDVLRWSGAFNAKKFYQYIYSNEPLFLVRKKEIFQFIISNSFSSKPHSSSFRGVTWHKNNQKWLANISHCKKRINLGYYQDQVDAAKAYDAAVIKFSKPKIKLNFKLEEVL